MARKSGTFRQGFLTTGANATTTIEAWLTLMDTDVGTATNITLSISATVAAVNGGGDAFSHKLSCSTSAATLAKAKLQTASLVTTCLTALVVTDSNYATIETIDVTVTATMSN